MNKITFIIILSILLVSCANEQRKSKDEFFVFEPDIRLFTSYAFMNAAGYGHDWNATMHPIRTEVREYLDSILTDDYKNEIRQYYEKFGGGDFYAYGVYGVSAQCTQSYTFFNDFICNI